jgi:CubicO group peptidase (beta-lactamase class C family)
MKKQASKFFSLALLAISLTSNAQTNQISEKQIADINNLIEDLSNKDAFSGTVLIAKGDKIIYQKAVGLSNKEQNMKNNIETKFNIGSMNKMFTGIAIAQLAEKNKLRYSDKITSYLPNLPKKIFGDITIEQLLTHSSGTGDFFRFPRFEQIADTAKTIATYVNIGLEEPLLFKPGTKVSYSNYGYILLGAIIESVSKMSYYDYVRQNIFVIANMKNTDSYERNKIHENFAIGYANPPQMPNETPKLNNRENNTKILELKGNSAGGGYSTAVDFHKFSQALLANKLITSKTLGIVTTGKVILFPGMKERNLPEIKYGYGFGESYKNNIRIIGHTGGAPGVDEAMEIYPDLGYTVVVLSNYDRATMPIMKFIQDVITQNK